MVELEEPMIYKETTSRPETAHWKTAIEEELRTHEFGWTHEQSNLDSPRILSKNKRTIKSKWVFKIKRSVIRIRQYKAWLCAKGFSQRYGIDYHEIFVPVARRFHTLIVGHSSDKGFRNCTI